MQNMCQGKVTSDVFHHSRPRKQQYMAENSLFSSIYFLCVEIPILKIVLSHSHRWVTSVGYSLEINFSLVISSPGVTLMVYE